MRHDGGTADKYRSMMDWDLMRKNFFFLTYDKIYSEVSSFYKQKKRGLIKALYH